MPEPKFHFSTLETIFSVWSEFWPKEPPPDLEKGLPEPKEEPSDILDGITG